MLIKAGSTLLVPRNEARHADVSERLADNAAMHLVADAPPLRRSTVTARKGDSVASIATRYRVSAASVANWNKVSASAKFAAGQPVVVYTPAKVAKAKTTASKASARKPAAKAAGGSSKRSADKRR
jgi:membrane-bound lytic murein transglycosylase D